jgi:pyruvate kinase
MPRRGFESTKGRSYSILLDTKVPIIRSGTLSGRKEQFA